MANPRELREIGFEEAKQRGIWTEHSQMPNGEFRYRLRHRDGTAYIRTEATENSGWQKSHFHKSVRETYIVQSGKIALAEWVNNALRVRVFGPGQICTTEPLVSHNVYLFSETIIHTVKHGEEGEAADWHANTSLDAETCRLDESQILRLALK